MKSPIAAIALAGSLAAAAALAQAPTPRAATAPAAPTGSQRRVPQAPPAPDAQGLGSRSGSTTGRAPLDPDVREASEVLPGPTFPDPNQPLAITLPDDPIEPYLLTKENGPFMVLAKTFRGPDSERFALALVLELRRDYNLPAYILRTKDFPRNSNIRNVPPTAPAFQQRADVGLPEKVRTYDEAAVLVGNEKSLADQERLWREVKKIKPKCLDGMPSLFKWREGLGRALRTTNPYVPAQNLFPAKHDTLIARMNQGPHTIFRCPGRYTLPIAEFSGRSTFNVEGAMKMGDTALKESPLMTAADDAERLADALAKAPEIQQTGYQPYVFHDRTSSKVTIGAFNSPNDPAAVMLRETLLRLAVPIMDTKDAKGRKVRNRGIDTMIAPANYLIDIDPIKPHL
ncbi:MAG: hypothetical protein JO116_21175 [Planctomycetaceae bacterium]|nr:hypothetical protein [Planctomycetaceae bacterium]